MKRNRPKLTFEAPFDDPAEEERETIEFVASSSGDVFERELLNKEYELKDHLGNVRVVHTDLKAVVAPGAWAVEVVSWNNYYPFGMLQPGRHGQTEKYRYGFNGKEMDNEVMEDGVTGESGEGASYDYGFRINDARIGRFSSMDPLSAEYTSWSPFSYALNRPVSAYDPDGRYVEVSGNVADEAVSIMNGKTPFPISLDESNRLSVPLIFRVDESTIEGALLAAIYDNTNGVNLFATREHYTTALLTGDRNTATGLRIGAFVGVRTSVNTDGVRFESQQAVNLDMAEAMESIQGPPVDAIIMHEVVEGYQASYELTDVRVGTPISEYRSRFVPLHQGVVELDNNYVAGDERTDPIESLSPDRTTVEIGERNNKTGASITLFWLDFGNTVDPDSEVPSVLTPGGGVQ